MDEKELDLEAKIFQSHLEFVFQQGAMLALLPIEEMLDAFEHADAVGPIVDPTLYRKWIHSGRDGMMKEVLKAALEFKAAILQAQADYMQGKIR